MNVTDFLTHHGITLDDVIAEASASLRLVPADVLLVSGSLHEGRGNEKSDLDLYLVTGRSDIPLTSVSAVTLAVGRAILDVRVVGRSEIEALVERFGAWARQPRLERASAAFAENERKLLHRLRNCRTLYGEDDFEWLRESLSPTDLARLRLDWACYIGATIQIDLAGLRSAGDFESMPFAAQELLGHTVDALLAGYGYSNPSWKWRVRELNELPPEWERELCGHPSGMFASDMYRLLHRVPPNDGPGAALGHALRIAAFSRRVFPWAERRLLDPHSPSPPPMACARTLSARVLPDLDLDVTVRYRNGRFELLRLNGDGRVFGLSPNAYSLLCAFDGETSVEDATLHAERLWGDGGTEWVDEVTALVRYGGFEAPAFFDDRALNVILRRSAGGDAMTAEHEGMREREFDRLMRRHGICVPSDRRAGALAVHEELIRMAKILRQSRNAASEEASVSNMGGIRRDGR